VGVPIPNRQLIDHPNFPVGDQNTKFEGYM